ncbi:MAG: carbohydrate-binding family 9-like protein, partial [Bacteroidota bacterium]|nr:carbohydrate-binding family 9-like protein [Bacteroidota bacterium]
MKTIHVPFLKNISVETSIESASQVIDTINESHAMDCLNWPDEFPEKPTVMFKFARIEDCLLIKFFVEEDITVAAYSEDNQP